MDNTRQHDDEQELAAIRSWKETLAEVEQRIGRHFARSEARQRAIDYLRGLMSQVERKKGIFAYPPKKVYSKIEKDNLHL